MNKIEIDTHNIPQHIAIIMDGNGRWANAKGLPRITGHREGVRTVRKITEICGKLGVQILTLYTFSSENWNRPPNEVSALMKLLLSSLRREVKDLMKNNVRFTVIGNINELESNVQNELLDAIHKTKNNTGLNLNLALSYGSRQEILFAAKSRLASDSTITPALPPSSSTTFFFPARRLISQPITGLPVNVIIFIRGSSFSLGSIFFIIFFFIILCFFLTV